MKLLVLPGDGIGPEIVSVTTRALEALDRRFGLTLDLEERAIGFASLQSEGTTLPDAVVEAAKAADGIVLGPADTAEYPPPEEGGVNVSAALRTRLDLYANIRPSAVRAGVAAHVPAMDLVVVRENTEGFYADRNMFSGSGEFMPTSDVALAVRKITREGSRRIIEVAFRLAEKRRRRLTVVNKANVLKVSDGLFLEVAHDVARAHPNVEVEDVHVDAMASLLIREPERFDVVVSTNMFGDILSNEAAELSGGLGLAGSLNMGDRHAAAQASHGSAPDIAGTDRANPTAIVASAAMLLGWLAEKHQSNALAEAAECLDRNLSGVLADAATRTVDLGGKLGTQAFGEALATRIAAGK